MVRAQASVRRSQGFDFSEFQEYAVLPVMRKNFHEGRKAMSQGQSFYW
jgi:hypothetical protein